MQLFLSHHLSLTSCWAFLCGEEELVRQVHTLFVRSEQQVVVYELQVQEEVEGVRQEAREIRKGRAKRRETLT